jgi:hypothetical protein
MTLATSSITETKHQKAQPSYTLHIKFTMVGSKPAATFSAPKIVLHKERQYIKGLTTKVQFFLYMSIIYAAQPTLRISLQP